MKKIVIFFVNPTQISILSNKTIDSAKLPDSNNYWVISSDGYYQKHNVDIPMKIETLGKDILIVVSDTFDVTPILNLITINNKDNQIDIFAVFHHNAGNAGRLSDLFLKTLGISFKSSLTEHEITGSVYDRYLIPLLKNFLAGLFRELLSRFPDPILEEKLILLHECLVPGSIPKILSPILLSAPQSKDLKTAYDSFLKSAEGKTDENCFDSDYIDALTKLRIALLGS